MNPWGTVILVAVKAMAVATIWAAAMKAVQVVESSILRGAVLACIPHKPSVVCEKCRLKMKKSRRSLGIRAKPIRVPGGGHANTLRG